METNYFWDAVTGTCLAELDENGDVTVQYTTNPQTGELISENHAGEEVYHHYDGDGNTRQTTDSAGNVLGEATYDAFGEPVAESGDMKTTYRFRGKRGHTTDVVTGDISKSSQIYSPSLGRGLSVEFGLKLKADFQHNYSPISIEPTRLPRVTGNRAAAQRMHRRLWEVSMQDGPPIQPWCPPMVPPIVHGRPGGLIDILRKGVDPDLLEPDRCQRLYNNFMDICENNYSDCYKDCTAFLQRPIINFCFPTWIDACGRVKWYYLLNSKQRCVATECEPELARCMAIADRALKRCRNGQPPATGRTPAPIVDPDPRPARPLPREIRDLLDN